jgi:pyruvate ferredoxin oxidoreductase beta subunit
MCAGCGVAIAVHQVSRSSPKNVIISCATSCLEVTTSAYPTTAWNVPWIHAAFETSASVASGVEAAVKRLGKDWKVIGMAGDGGTFDIGIQALSGMLERGHKVTQICLDNEAYMNTGIQRSGGTPHAAWTTTSPPGKKTQGKEEWKKPLADIVAAHRIPYVASASIAYFPDLKTKVKKALEKQPSFLHIYSPCPTGWKSDISQSVAIAKLAVETGAWPLFEIEDGEFRITRKIPKRKPVQEYLKTQGRFKHLTPETIKDIQKHMNLYWKELEAREKASSFHIMKIESNNFCFK